jgi:acyl-CoA reductase-like NAD-dependent aldehyde dehydrogenase
MAVNAANHSLTAWTHDVTKRRQALNNCAEVLLSNIDSLAKLITEEQGKPLRDSNREIRRLAELIKDFAKLEFPFQILQDDKTRKVELQRSMVCQCLSLCIWMILEQY